MKTFKRFYYNILEQLEDPMTATQGTSAGVNDSSSKQANTALMRAIRARMQALRTSLQRVQKTSTIKEQISEPSPSLARLLARRQAAREKAQEALDKQRERNQELAAKREEEENQRQKIEAAIEKDRLNR